MIFQNLSAREACSDCYEVVVQRSCNENEISTLSTLPLMYSYSSDLLAAPLTTFVSKSVERVHAFHQKNSYYSSDPTIRSMAPESICKVLSTMTFNLPTSRALRPCVKHSFFPIHPPFSHFSFPFSFFSVSPISSVDTRLCCCSVIRLKIVQMCCVPFHFLDGRKRRTTHKYVFWREPKEEKQRRAKEAKQKYEMFMVSWMFCCVPWSLRN